MCYLHTLSRCISLAFLDYKLGKLLEKCLNFASGAILSSLSTGSYSLARGTFSKLHKIIPLPHKIWRQRSACDLTARDLWDLPFFSCVWGNRKNSASGSTFRENCTHTNPSLSEICRPFEFHTDTKLSGPRVEALLWAWQPAQVQVLYIKPIKEFSCLCTK